MTAVDLDLQSVSKSYGTKRSGVLVAVDGVSLSVGGSQSIGIVGESGSGKSTLAKMMVALEEPTAGSVVWNGEDLRGLKRPGVLDFYRAVQFVAQDTTASFDPRRTLRDSVREPARVLRGLGRREADAEVDRVADLVGLAPSLADRHPRDVSGGQRQRFAVARALIVNPALLVCDEAVSALDVSIQGTVLNVLKGYCAERHAGLVFVSHGLPATAFVSESLVVLYRGRIVESGPTEQVLNRPEHPYTKALLAAHAGGRHEPDALVGTALKGEMR